MTFNNHSVAAGLITGALALTVLEPPGRRAGRRRFVAGLLAALAATIDLPAGGAMLAGLGIVQAIRARSIPWAFLAGSAGPLLLHAWLQSKVTGTPLPVEMYPEAFDYPGLVLDHARGDLGGAGPALAVRARAAGRAAGMADGHAGPGLRAGRDGPGARPPGRPAAADGVRWSAGSVLVLVAYYTWGVRRTDFAGPSFGIRHLLPMAPAVFVFAAVGARPARGPAAPSVFAAADGDRVRLRDRRHEGPLEPGRGPRADEPALRRRQRLVIYPWTQAVREIDGR